MELVFDVAVERRAGGGHVDAGDAEDFEGR